MYVCTYAYIHQLLRWSSIKQAPSGNFGPVYACMCVCMYTEHRNGLRPVLLVLCMHVCMFVCMHTQHACLYACIHTYDLCMYVRTYILHTFVHIYHMHTWGILTTHASVKTICLADLVSTHTHIYMYTYVHIYIYIYIHITCTHKPYLPHMLQWKQSVWLT